MDFNQDQKVVVDSLNKTEAKAFIKFLYSEIIRHALDIEQAGKLIDTVKEKFNL